MTKNKWEQPSQPPPPLFAGKKERDLVKQVNDELIERVIGQQIIYYPISIDETNFHPIYGEALNKAFLFVLVGYIVHFFSGNTDMRQMGGAYLYSMDIASLLFGVCFNLAGLPYSAGFLGKEFLLFQVLRDDFLSLWVRGC